MDNNTLTVTQVGNYIKNIFDAEEMLHNIDVVGEISGFSITRDIAYFTLKDENSIMSCVLFGASKYSTIKNGDSVIVTGTPRYYVKGGKLNFNATKIVPYGQGQLFIQFMQLKQKLEAEGIFDISHKKQIPKNVKKIGVVTSETGAVIQDIINVSTRRNPNINIVLYPVKVQGANADLEIVKGIEFFNNYDVDVVIVARGGGSMEDLQPYNMENVAMATYNCNKPIVSAVGHETDFTIIDFVSDLRAPTPSAAAELICENRVEQITRLKKCLNALTGLSSRFIQDKFKSLQMSSIRLEHAQEKILNNTKNKCLALYQRLYMATNNLVNEKNYTVAMIEKSLEKLNPKSILERGYARIQQGDVVLDSIDKVDFDKPLETYLKDGIIISKPIEKKEN